MRTFSLAFFLLGCDLSHDESRPKTQQEKYEEQNRGFEVLNEGFELAIGKAKSSDFPRKFMEELKSRYGRCEHFNCVCLFYDEGIRGGIDSSDLINGDFRKNPLDYSGHLRAAVAFFITHKLLLIQSAYYNDMTDLIDIYSPDKVEVREYLYNNAINDVKDLYVKRFARGDIDVRWKFGD